MQLISIFKEGFQFLVCVIDIYSKYVLVIPLKDKKALQLLMLFKKNLHESNWKLKKIWVDKGSEFCNSSVKDTLKAFGDFKNKQKSIRSNVV